MTGLRNTEYLNSFFRSPEEMAELSGLSIETCNRIMYIQSFQPMIVHLQALIKSGIDLNEYLTVKIEA